MAACNIKVELVGDSFKELRGEIAGPPDTPYEGGKFKLEIKIPETYPFNPPQVFYFWKVFFAMADMFVCPSFDVLNHEVGA